MEFGFVVGLGKVKTSNFGSDLSRGGPSSAFTQIFQSVHSRKQENRCRHSNPIRRTQLHKEKVDNFQELWMQHSIASAPTPKLYCTCPNSCMQLHLLQQLTASKPPARCTHLQRVVVHAHGLIVTVDQVNYVCHDCVARILGCFAHHPACSQVRAWRKLACEKSPHLQLKSCTAWGDRGLSLGHSRNAAN